MRVLWMSDTPRRPSGFGLVTLEVCRRLARRGHAVTILGWWDEGPQGEFEGVPVLPCPVAPAEAGRTLMQWVAALRPDALVTLGDIPWVGYAGQLPVRSTLDRHGVAWCPYFPVDGALPNGALPADWIAVLRQADLPIAMSRFGVEACARSGIDAVHIPHGCDTLLFRPPADKEEAKRRVGCAGRFVILSDARNHRRKLLPLLLDIVRLFRSGKDDVALLLNTNRAAREDTDVYSYDIEADIRATGLATVALLGPESGAEALPMSEVAAMHAAADVHLLTSWGEGFGLPTLQAAASGVASVGGDHSATSELLRGRGIAVRGGGTALDEFGLVRTFIDRREAAAALEQLYRDGAYRERLGRAGRQFAETLTWDAVTTRWERHLRAASPQRGRETPRPARSSRVTRPTGHDGVTLPVPRLTIPVHARRVPCPGSGRLSHIVLVSPAYTPLLRSLSALFPSVVVQEGNSPGPAEAGFHDELAGVILVIDPGRDLHPALDLFCALASVSFIGPSPYWPAVGENSLLLQARRLLTDHPLTERRWAHALSVARRSIVQAAGPGSQGQLLEKPWKAL